MIPTANMLNQSRRKRETEGQQWFHGSTRASGGAEARDANGLAPSSISMIAVYEMVRHPSWGSVHGSGRYASGLFYELIEKSPSGNGAQPRKRRMEINLIRGEGRRLWGRGLARNLRDFCMVFPGTRTGRYRSTHQYFALPSSLTWTEQHTKESR